MSKTATISARSRQQAMDWSLALASQGILATIVHEAETDRWGLFIEAPDRGRAASVLRQYHLENRAWKWEEPLPWPGMVFHVGSVLVCAYLALIHFLTVQYFPAWRDAASMSNVAFAAGEWWRLFTAVSLHADAAHLAMNLATGLILIGLAMGRFGGGVGMLAAYLTGAAGNLLGAWLYTEPYRGLGASGMVLGALGLLAFESAAHWRQRGRARKLATAFGAALMLFVLFGANPNSDLVAHLGGFLAGCLFGSILALMPEGKLKGAKLNRVGWASVLLLGCLTWSLALKT